VTPDWVNGAKARLPTEAGVKGQRGRMQSDRESAEMRRPMPGKAAAFVHYVSGPRGIAVGQLQIPNRESGRTSTTTKS
jgi:hypothetical protein